MVEIVEVQNWPKTLLIPSPIGFCAGVRRAIDALDRVVTNNPGETVYAYHEIIHNDQVVSNFQARGVRFVGELKDIPPYSLLTFSAHGVSPEIIQAANDKNLRWEDATCPLVKKPQTEAVRFAALGYDILYIAHANHDETLGTMGWAPNAIRLVQNLEDARNILVSDPNKVALITQTTLSQDETAEMITELENRFPKIVKPKKEDICYATQNRQDGVKEAISRGAEAFVAVGSPSSSNTNRLREVAESLGTPAYLVNYPEELNPNDFRYLKRVGLTAGASAPDDQFYAVVKWFKDRGSEEVIDIVVADESKISFTPVASRGK